PALKFKASGKLPDVPLAKTVSKKVEQLKKQPTKEFVGSGQHYYPKSGVGFFLMERGAIQTGDTLVILGPTTGEIKVVLESFFVNGQPAQKAQSGDKVTLSVSERIRKSDMVYKLVNE